MPRWPTYPDRILSRFEALGPDDCWPWNGSFFESGHGCSRSPEGKAENAHVSVYRLLVGPVPDGYQLDHLCHSRASECPGGNSCPHRACVNPFHMEPVTQRVNLLRGQSPLAKNARKTHCPHGHPLEGDNLVKSQLPWRICKTCKYAANRARDKRTRSTR